MAVPRPAGRHNVPHHKNQRPEELDKETKAPTWPPSSSDPNMIERQTPDTTGHPQRSCLHASIRAKSNNTAGPPSIGFVAACPTDARSDRDLGKLESRLTPCALRHIPWAIHEHWCIKVTSTRMPGPNRTFDCNEVIIHFTSGSNVRALMLGLISLCGCFVSLSGCIF